MSETFELEKSECMVVKVLDNLRSGKKYNLQKSLIKIEFIKADSLRGRVLRER